MWNVDARYLIGTGEFAILPAWSATEERESLSLRTESTNERLGTTFSRVQSPKLDERNLSPSELVRIGSLGPRNAIAEEATMKQINWRRVLLIGAGGLISLLLVFGVLGATLSRGG